MPVEVNRSPELPAYAGPRTMVVVSSYSGNTAETLASFEEAVARGCRVLPITSGGTLAARADELGLGAVRIPGGYMPRAALGYLALSLLGAMEAVGLLPRLADDVDEATGELDRLVEALGPDLPTDRNEAKALAERIGHRQPVVWGADGLGAVAAARWKTQLNENGKVPAWSAALPELDHNEVVGWYADRGAGSFVVALRHEGEHDDVAVRFPISLEIARDAGAITEEVWATGRSALARFLSLAIMGDFVSCYVGLRQGVDPSPIAAIDRLKAFLDGAPVAMSEQGLPGPGDDLAAQAAAVVRSATDLEPRAGVVLGSGLGPALGDALERDGELLVHGSPGLPALRGAWTRGQAGARPPRGRAGRRVLRPGPLLRGPRHGRAGVAAPPRRRNSGPTRWCSRRPWAGSCPGRPRGTVVILRDHLNMMGVAPLRGWRYPDGMPTFISTTGVYDEALRDLAFERAQALGIASSIGVYAAMSGPAYETPTEVRMLQAAGATVVGMSMVPEALPATALEMRVLGICSLTNAFGEHVEHEEVVRVSNETAVAVGRLLVDLFPRM